MTTTFCAPAHHVSFEAHTGPRCVQTSVLVVDRDRIRSHTLLNTAEGMLGREHLVDGWEMIK